MANRFADFETDSKEFRLTEGGDGGTVASYTFLNADALMSGERQKR